MITPILTTEQEFQMALLPGKLEPCSKQELITAYIELYKAYLLADNYRRVSAAKELLGLDASDIHLQKFQKQTEGLNYD